ncbi:MAG TPA: class I SAM-dependent methyltransferase [Croceibacterium sp.]|nr:class I SAM-dependent methyltransferase [Croceibacterium sp.]
MAMDWQGRTGAAWAAEWRRTDRIFAGVTERLLSRSRDFAFQCALDVGCGAGELSLALARGRPRVEIVGIDISPQLIEAARERGSHLLNARFEVADATQWRPDEDFAPDFLISRHGVMFFNDPTTAFAHLREIAGPGAGLLFSCFRGPEVNEMIAGIAELLPPPAKAPDPHAPGPLAFADPDYVRPILENAGWHDVTFEAHDFATVVGAGPDPLGDAVEFFSTIGPLAEAASQMGEAERERLFARVRGMLEPRILNGTIALRGGAWIVGARKG